MSDIDRIDQRLAAVERAVVDGDRELDQLADLAALADDLDRLEARLEAHERRIATIEGTVDAFEGFVGNVESVNESVERQADAAIAAVDRLEYWIDDLEETIGSRESRGIGNDARDSTNERVRVEGGRETRAAVEAGAETRAAVEAGTEMETGSETGPETGVELLTPAASDSDHEPIEPDRPPRVEANRADADRQERTTNAIENADSTNERAGPEGTASTLLGGSRDQLKTGTSEPTGEQSDTREPDSTEPPAEESDDSSGLLTSLRAWLP